MKKELYNDGIGYVELIDYMGNDARAVHSARVSFLKDGSTANLNQKDKKLLNFLLKEKHTSPFEHSVISLKLHIPLYVRNHIMRHRTFSFNEVSRRYTEENIQFHIPSEFRAQAKKNLQCSAGVLENSASIKESYKLFIQDAFNLYIQILEAGVAREQARTILPQSIYTSFFMTGNLLNWIKFLQIRTGETVQAETKEVAEAIQVIISSIFPETFKALNL